MTDIVERLRQGPSIHDIDDMEVMQAAADEIERLRNKEKNQMNYLLLKMAEMTENPGSRSHRGLIRH